MVSKDVRIPAASSFPRIYCFPDYVVRREGMQRKVVFVSRLFSGLVQIFELATPPKIVTFVDIPLFGEYTGCL